MLSKFRKAFWITVTFLWAQPSLSILLTPLSLTIENENSRFLKHSSSSCGTRSHATVPISPFWSWMWIVNAACDPYLQHFIHWLITVLTASCSHFTDSTRDIKEIKPYEWQLFALLFTLCSLLYSRLHSTRLLRQAMMRLKIRLIILTNNTCVGMWQNIC